MVSYPVQNELRAPLSLALAMVDDNVRHNGRWRDVSLEHRASIHYLWVTGLRQIPGSTAMTSSPTLMHSFGISIDALLLMPVAQAECRCACTNTRPN